MQDTLDPPKWFSPPIDGSRRQTSNAVSLEPWSLIMLRKKPKSGFQKKKDRKEKERRQNEGKQLMTAFFPKGELSLLVMHLYPIKVNVVNSRQLLLMYVC